MVKKNTTQSTKNVTPVVQTTPAVQATPVVQPAPVQTAGGKKSKKTTQSAGTVEQPVVAPVQPVVAPVVAQVQPVTAPVQTAGGKKSKKATQSAGNVEQPVAQAPASTPVVQTAGETTKPRKTATKTPRQTKAKKTAETKPKRGGKKVVAVAPVQADAPADGEEKGRFFKYLYNGTVSGRFSGSKPKQAANKALTSIVKSQSETGTDLTNKMLTFSIIECTRGSKKKQYNYQGIRRALDTPIKVTIKNKDVPIVYKFQNKTSKLKVQPVATASA
jgi:hypothetical protein